ncbi:MAG: hypothetical protein QXJ12_01740 [Candidatus Parvarchaeota archaeon]|nr:hypothetical protein [Candidatus Parvarchaeota archaeon]
MKYQSLIFIAVFSVILMIGVVHAVGYGTSKISLSQSSVNISQGGSASVTFTDSLTSGTYWGTNINIAPSSGYITLSASPSNGEPNPAFSGTITVTAAADTPPGVYTFNISATGDDPSSSPATLTVYVSKSNSTAPIVTPAPPVTSTATVNYFDYILVIFLIVIAALVAAAYSMKKRFERTARIGSLISIIVSLASALYLLIYDSLLRTSGMLHYDILIVFFIGTVILAYLMFYSKRSQRTAELLLGSLSALFVLAMFADALLGLPLTSVAGSTAYGINYLFGFGSPGTFSVFGISLAFSLLLLSTTATSILTLFLCLKKKKK